MDKRISGWLGKNAPVRVRLSIWFSIDEWDPKQKRESRFQAEGNVEEKHEVVQRPSFEGSLKQHRENRGLRRG